MLCVVYHPHTLKRYCSGSDFHSHPTEAGTLLEGLYRHVYRRLLVGRSGVGLLQSQPTLYELYLPTVDPLDFSWLLAEVPVYSVFIPMVYTTWDELEGTQQSALALPHIGRVWCSVDPRVEGSVNEGLHSRTTGSAHLHAVSNKKAVKSRASHPGFRMQKSVLTIRSPAKSYAPY